MLTCCCNRNDEVIVLSGGAAGVRDVGLLESALARPQNLYAYEGVADLVVLAATYAAAVSVITRSSMATKGAAFVCMGQFLADNGLSLLAAPREAADVFLALAAGDLDAEQLAEWLRRNVQTV
jgi:death-on-curing protein